MFNVVVIYSLRTWIRWRFGLLAHLLKGCRCSCAGVLKDAIAPGHGVIAFHACLGHLSHSLARTPRFSPAFTSWHGRLENAAKTHTPNAPKNTKSCQTLQKTRKAARQPNNFRHARGITMQNVKRLGWASIEPRTSRLTIKCTSHLNLGTFSYSKHPQYHLIGADREKYPLINDSLVSTILS